MNSNIYERLKASGFNPETKRGQVWLDGNPVHGIVEMVPVSFTRRRYSNATFCWVKAYVNGWFEMGDPWQKITPSYCDIATALAAMEPKYPGNPAN